jgi:hypothetical protein
MSIGTVPLNGALVVVTIGCVDLIENRHFKVLQVKRHVPSSSIEEKCLKQTYVGLYLRVESKAREQLGKL